MKRCLCIVCHANCKALIVFLLIGSPLHFLTAQPSAWASLFEFAKIKKIEDYLNAAQEEVTKNPQRASEQLYLAWPLINSIRLPRHLGRYYQIQGVLALHNANHKAAINHFFAALNAFQNRQDKLSESQVYLQLGHIFQSQRNFQKAIDYYQIGLNILKNYPRQTLPLKAQFHLQLGTCNLALKRFIQARSQLEQSRELSQKTKIRADLSITLYRLGQLERMHERVNIAQDIFLEAYQLTRKQQWPELEFKIANELCMLSLEEGVAEKAREYILSMKSLAQSLRNEYYLQLAHVLTAKTFFGENKLDSAMVYNTLVLENIDPHRDSLIRELWIQRGDILAQQNQTLAAIDALEKVDYWDEKINLNSEKLEIERQQHELTIQSVEKKLHRDFEQYFRQERWIRYSMLFAVFFAATLSFYFLFKINLRHKANRELQKQNSQIEAQRNQLEQLSQIKDQLFAVISHDLRSPLLAIHEVLNTLDEPDITPADRNRWLDLLHQQTAKTSLLLENSLYWANLQINNYRPDPVEIHLYPIVEEIKETLQLIFADKSIRIDNQVSPNFTMRPDPGMIRMALRNLMTNAVKFSDSGQAIQVSALRTKEKVEIVIKDHGIGMSTEQLKKALNGQLSRFGTKGESGSGIGLSLVRQFIERNGGTLNGQAALNEGCTFTITLPSCHKAE